MTIERTPETSAACQVLYHAADAASKAGRAVLFSAIRCLTGYPLDVVERTWKGTRPPTRPLTYADRAYRTRAERLQADRDDDEARNRWNR